MATRLNRRSLTQGADSAHDRARALGRLWPGPRRLGDCFGQPGRVTLSGIILGCKIRDLRWPHHAASTVPGMVDRLLRTVRAA